MTAVNATTRGSQGLQHPVWQTYQWELEKLTAQFRTRAATGLCLLGPLAFAVGLQLSSTVPADTLFGRWVDSSGYAIPLVVLGFAGSWALPLLTCLVAGDIFSSEDHYGTWTSVLTRSVSRGDVFAGKVLAALTYAVVVVVLLSGSSLASGVLLVGHQPLVGLSGNVETGGHAAALVALSWLVALPGVAVSATMGVAVSIYTRHSLAGIIAPTVVGLVLQLLLLVSGFGPISRYLPNAPYVAWHGLWANPSFAGPVAAALASAVVYALVLLVAAWMLFRRRDIGVV